MSRIMDVTARVLARLSGRALPVRSTSALAGDPDQPFGIAFLKIVSEEIVQAIAFGPVNDEPRILTRWNPLGREARDLEDFAESLDRYLTGSCAAGLMPRIWVAHGSALTLVELLGYRYRTNTMASDRLRRMGAQCRALAEEARMPGQQVVAVAGELLRNHFVTGQAPIKDAHLGAMLAWMNPAAGSDPTAEADERALVPASGVLERQADEDVEALRKRAKKGTPRQRQAAIDEIEALLAAGVRAEWVRLVEARAAFWAAGLGQAPGTGELVKASVDRIRFRLGRDLSPPSRPHSLARELEAQQRAAELVEESEMCGDRRLRERARRKGRVISGEVVRVIQPNSSRKPCTVFLGTHQDVLRLRKGTLLQRTDGKVVGRVEDVSEDGAGRRLVRLELTKGVRKSQRPTEGSVDDWVDAVPSDTGYMMDKVYDRMKTTAAPLVYQRGAAAAATSVGPAPVDLLAIAERLRSPR